MDDWDHPRLPYLWVIDTPDPHLLVTADGAHAHAVEQWDVGEYDRTTLDLYRTRMDAWHARHVWASTAPVRELVVDADRVDVPGAKDWNVPDSGIRALRACGLPATLFHRGYDRPRTPRWGPGPRHVDFHVLTGDRGGRPFRVERGTGRVSGLSPTPDSEPLASSLVAFVEIAWRWHHVDRIITEEDLDSGWVAYGAEDAEADFADLVRWIDPASCFPGEFPLIDHL